MKPIESAIGYDRVNKSAPFSSRTVEEIESISPTRQSYDRERNYQIEFGMNKSFAHSYNHFFYQIGYRTKHSKSSSDYCQS